MMRRQPPIIADHDVPPSPFMARMREEKEALKANRREGILSIIAFTLLIIAGTINLSALRKEAEGLLADLRDDEEVILDPDEACRDLQERIGRRLAPRCSLRGIREPGVVLDPDQGDEEAAQREAWDNPPRHYQGTP